MIGRYNLLAGSIAAASLGGYFGLPLVNGRMDRSALLPGAVSHGHYPIATKCDACHTPYDGVTNEACNRCHGASLLAAEDIHPDSKFADPRNADRVAGLDARSCVTCHREHVATRTRTGGVTMPADFCVKCHDDVARERPSHEGFSFDGCATTGCHRFHDNRGIYEGFLAQHRGEREVLDSPRVLRTMSIASGNKSLRAIDNDAPASAATELALREWEKSAHARAGVNCSGCHVVPDPKSGMAEWKDRPGRGPCANCHGPEEVGFLAGKHGMSLAVGLPPMTPDRAQKPMKAKAHGRTLDCSTCHGAHRVDTQSAAADACLTCHDDAHSRAFQASRHYQLWLREQRGEAAPGTGVSCATCHMPGERTRDHGADRVHVQHNQNATLRPRDKMIRSVCTHCHGLGFTIDALSDETLVERNFNGRPAAHVSSLEMVERRLSAAKRREP